MEFTVLFQPFEADCGAKIIKDGRTGKVVLQRFLLPRRPPQIIKTKDYNPCYKWNHRNMPVGKTSEKDLAVEAKKFAYHPVAVGQNPYTDGQVMA